jgi:hypothetical protein
LIFIPDKTEPPECSQPAIIRQKSYTCILRLLKILADYIPAGEGGKEEPLHDLPVRKPRDLRSVLSVVNHLPHKEGSHGVSLVRKDIINPDQLPGVFGILPYLPHGQVGQYHAGTDCADNHRASPDFSRKGIGEIPDSPLRAAVGRQSCYPPAVATQSFHVVNGAGALLKHPVISNMGGKHQTLHIGVDDPGENLCLELMKRGLVAGGAGVVNPYINRAEGSDSPVPDPRKIILNSHIAPEGSIAALRELPV